MKIEANVLENSRADHFLLEKSHKRFGGFHKAMKARRTYFISFIKFLFSALTKSKTIYEARIYTLISFIKCKFSPYCSKNFRVPYSAMETYKQTNQNACIISKLLCKQCSKAGDKHQVHEQLVFLQFEI